MSYLYSKLPETGVSPHIGTGGLARRPRATSVGGASIVPKTEHFSNEGPTFAPVSSNVTPSASLMRL